jgi:biotin synthase
MRGANILMPLLTPGKFRADYQLYQNKPCLDEVASDCRGCLTMRVKLADKSIAWAEWGDPHHVCYSPFWLSVAVSSLILFVFVC